MAPGLNVSTELNNLFAKIQQVGSSSSNGGKLQGSDFTNCIFDVANSAGAFSENATPEEKASAVQKLVNQALSIFNKIANNESKTAKKEVSAQTKATQKLLAKSQKLGAELDGSLTNIQSNIESQTAIVTDAQKLLKETQKSIEEKQNEIQKIVEAIEEKQKELAAATTDEDKAAILQEIKGLAQGIADIGLSIKDESEQVDNLTKAVDDTTKDIEASTQQLAETQAEGLEELSEEYQRANQANSDIIKTSVTAAENKATGAAAQNTAQTTSVNPITGATIASKLYQIANDQNMAATTRLTGIAGNISTLAQGIGGLSNATEVLSSFQNSIGSALNGYADIVGQWDAQINPVLISLGSFDILATGLEELNTVVDTDMTTLGVDTNNSETKAGQTEKTEKTKDINVNEKPQENSNAETLNTVKYDIKKLQPFGI